MRRIAIIGWILALGILAACGTQPVANNSCPAIKNFTAQQEQAMMADLRKLSHDSPLYDMAADWIRMRDELKACQAN